LVKPLVLGVCEVETLRGRVVGTLRAGICAEAAGGD
jgi:hypothetical protein